MPPGTPDEVQPPAEPLAHATHQQPRNLPPRAAVPLPATPVSRPPSLINWRSAIPAALIGGVLAGFGTMIPFLPFILLCMVAAGGLSVTFYSRREINAQIFPGMGFRIGALAGLFGFVMDMIIVSLGMLSAATRANLRSEIANQAQQAIAKSQDPATTETLRNLTDKLNTTQGLVTLFLIAAVFYGFFFVVFSGIGGALGAYLFGHRKS